MTQKKLLKCLLQTITVHVLWVLTQTLKPNRYQMFIYLFICANQIVIKIKKKLITRTGEANAWYKRCIYLNSHAIAAIICDKSLYWSFNLLNQSLIEEVEEVGRLSFSSNVCVSFWVSVVREFVVIIGDIWMIIEIIMVITVFLRIESIVILIGCKFYTMFQN